MPKNNHLKQILVLSSTIGLSLFILFFVITCTWIGYDVKNQCLQAKKDYGNTCTESLIKLIEDKNRSFASRNSAIWALGQIGDSTALSVLQNLYTGNIPNREPLNETISQYELQKAIKLLDGGTNITAIFWRHGIN
ncbi:MAG: HEAT repeat domain-containing protein [Candidatus Shapirobacteria bacterium]|nr:HEAT repeat domain-containing protein [Candidatus Shapirobacteria bacterium]